MRYEEVETVLPKNFKPTRDAPASASASASEPSKPRGRGRSQASRRTVIERLRGSWRNSRRRLKSKSRKEKKAKEEASKARQLGEGKRGEAADLRKADSNATEIRSNRAKDLSGEKGANKAAEAEEREPTSEEKSLPGIRENCGAPDADLAENEESEGPDVRPAADDGAEKGAGGVANVSVPSLVKDFSVEVGDDVDTIEVGMPPLEPDLASPRSLCQVETVDETVCSFPRSSPKHYQEDKSRAIVKSKGTAVAARRAEPVVVEDVDQESAYENEQLALQDRTDSKWAKKVSISIAGYKTSFQFSDPMSNLAQKVNEALDVVGDAALAEEARGLDEIGDKTEEERDYDEDPTKLFMYLQQRAWGLASNQLKKTPEEAKVWVYRRSHPQKASNVEDGYRSRAMVEQSSALVARDGPAEPKLRWKLLPLHASIVLGAPSEIIMDIIRSYPAAARKPDERGSLPVHLAASRLDVDPDGEKVVLHLFGAYPDSVHAQDRKGRTPSELAKLARSRKEAEERRRLEALEAPGIEKTASSFRLETEADAEEDDDVSVKSGISARFKMMVRKSKSMDIHDRKKKGKKKVSSDASVASLSKARSADADEEMGPGFAFLKPSKSYEARVKSERGGCLADEDDDTEEEEAESTPPVPSAGSFYTPPAMAPSDTDAARSIPLPESLASPLAIARTGSFFTPPSQAPSATDAARSIPLPQSFSVAEDDVASVRSSASKASVKSSSSKASVKSNDSKASAKSAGSKASVSVKSTASEKSSGSKSSNKSNKSTGSMSKSPTSKSPPQDLLSPCSVTTQDPLSPVAEQSVESGSVTTQDPLSPVAEQSVESAKTKPTPQEPAAAPESSAAETRGTPGVHNEALRLLLEKAAENVGRGGLDITEYLDVLEDEWVTDVEALRRLDGDTLDVILPIILSREVQRLMRHADSIDNKFLTEDTEKGRWVRSDQLPERQGRSSTRKKGKKGKRSSRKSKRMARSAPPIAEENLFDDDDDDQTCYSIKTEAPAPPVQSHANSKVMIHEAPTEVKEFEAEEQHVEEQPSEVDGELEIRKLHANLIADARKKFPTRESLEDAIRERQQEVEKAVNSGFDVDKQTLSRAALADDEVRRLLPLRLILPSIHDLTEMIGVLQVHKENALRNTNLKKALRLQGEIDELQQQLDLEKQYALKRKLDMATAGSKCITCGESFTPETKMVGILKTKEFKCPNCRGGGLIASLVGGKSAEKEEKTREPTVEAT